MILNIYKPKTWTSFDVVAKLRGILKTKKVGHAGTLDPLAEGVLVVLTEKDTKKQAEFMMFDKEYIAEVAFGCESPTYDMEITPTLVKQGLQDINVAAILSEFIGEIDQKAPIYSAKKYKGKALYKYAREGKEDKVEIPTKRVTIYSLEILDFYNKDIETDKGVFSFLVYKIKIVCSSGTYIRSLAHDLGEKLGTGGVLYSLVRTRVGNYKIEDSIKELESLSQPSQP